MKDNEEKRKGLLEVEKLKNASEELERITIGEGAFVKPIGKSDVSPRYYCTVRQLAAFQSANDNQKAKIVEGYVNEPDRRSFWHQMSEAAVRLSLIKRHDSRPIYNEINRLKNLAPYTGAREKNKEANRKLCIKDLELYLKIHYPLKFRELKREEIRLKRGSVKYYDYLGIRIKVTPDYVFRTNIDGKAYVGGVRLRMSKGKKFKLVQHRIVSHFLKKFLEKHVAAKDEEVLPELCLFVDVYEGKVVTAPSGTDIPHKVIEEVCLEFAEIWDRTPGK